MTLEQGPTSGGGVLVEDHFLDEAVGFFVGPDAAGLGRKVVEFQLLHSCGLEAGNRSSLKAQGSIKTELGKALGNSRSLVSDNNRERSSC